jgi:hypothetical protein
MPSLARLAALSLATALVAGTASAATAVFQVTDTAEGTDCPGYSSPSDVMGDWVEDYFVCGGGSNQTGSTVALVQFVFENGAITDVILPPFDLIEANSPDFLKYFWPTITGEEFSFTFDPGSNFTSGTWSYAPGEGDPPTIWEFAATGAPNFEFPSGIGFLFNVRIAEGGYLGVPWATFGDDLPSQVSDCCDEGWIVYQNRAMGPLVRMTFYSLVDNPDDTAPIPLPAAGWLLLAGLGGLRIAARRRG